MIPAFFQNMDQYGEVDRWLRLPAESRFLILARIIGMMEATKLLIQEGGTRL